jgi:exodeoxyribonuclease V beta subunit
MKSFDPLGPLPAAGSTTVLEASAGTGKTFALAALVTRYLAEGAVTLDEMLLITFSRAATRELRERVRCQITDTVAALDDGSTNNELAAYLRRGSADECAGRARRLREAVAGFDAATIATTHQFCNLVLKSLGVAGDDDPDSELTEGLDDLVVRIVNDLYLRHFGAAKDQPPLSYDDALALARKVVGDPCVQLRPRSADPGSVAAVRLTFANDVRRELELRKRRLGILGYDDLLSRLADAVGDPNSDAADRMRRRWTIVMVDEFQDTDPVQWQVISRAFGGHSTLVLIADPKQAIYAFRGGDIVTYLDARRSADEQQTLDVNWRSDQAFVDSLYAVLAEARLGDPEIVVRNVAAARRGHRLAGAPHNAPFRLRVVSRAAFGVVDGKTIPISTLREYIPADLAADIAALLASDATFDGEPVAARNIAVIVERNGDAQACQNALAAAGIPAVYTGDSDVFKSPAVDDWLSLLTAFDQTHRIGLVRAAAATVFFGMTADELVSGGDALTDKIAATLRNWADHLRNCGPAAVFESAQLAGLSRRVLSEHNGERMMTDLAHIAQLCNEAYYLQKLTLPALRDWLRRQRDERGGPAERNRRIDSDAAAVQIMTVWGAKGLQFPIVYLPFAFNRYVFVEKIPLFHDDGVRCLHVGGKDDNVQQISRVEAARNDIRLAYVALTRAQSQVVAWWAPAKDEPHGGLSRLLRGRRAGEAAVPDRCVPPTISDVDALACFRQWEVAGGPVIEESVVAGVPSVPRPESPVGLAVRHFHRSIDTTWRRTSYSALIRRADEHGVSSEPEVTARDDETDVLPVAPRVGADVASPMAAMPAGATFGSLVHAVLENTDPFAADLATELEAQVRLESAWWSVDVDPAVLAAALVPMHDTPLGPLIPGLTLRQIGVRDRLREMDFEIPLAGGDVRSVVPEIRLSDVGLLLREHLATDDPVAGYADRLSSDALGDQPLRGYLSGAIDAVLRLPEQRYLVVDYKTNHLGDTAADYSGPRLREAMLHSHYPLQALLYVVVLHRFLRWRQPGYDPFAHLGGVLYLFVRGMCGANTPVIGGQPCGVFSWQPPAQLVVAVSDLLDEGRPAA